MKPWDIFCYRWKNGQKDLKIFAGKYKLHADNYFAFWILILFKYWIVFNV